MYSLYLDILMTDTKNCTADLIPGLQQLYSSLFFKGFWYCSRVYLCTTYLEILLFSSQGLSELKMSPV